MRIWGRIIGGNNMRLTNRDFIYESNDFDMMCKFLLRENKIKQDNYTWGIGRLCDWKYALWNSKKFFPNFFKKNAHLWFNAFDELCSKSRRDI